MNLLLDTHAFLWWVGDSRRMGAKARAAIENPANTCFVSLVTAWELAIKASLGKIRLTKPVHRFVTEHVAANAFEVLGIEMSHVARLENLPHHHGDPFDRLIIAQAVEESLVVVSADRVLSKYGPKRVW